MAPFEDIKRSESRELGYKPREEADPSLVESTDRQVLLQALTDIHGGDKDPRLVSLAIEKAKLLKSTSNLMHLASMPEVPAAGRAAALAAATSGIANNRWPAYTGNVATELAQLGELTTSAPEFAEVRQNLTQAFDAYVAQHPQAARDVANYKIPVGPKPVMPEWMKAEKRTAELKAEANRANGVMFEANLSTGVNTRSGSGSPSGFTRKRQEEAYWAAVDEHNRTLPQPLSTDNPVNLRAREVLQVQNGQAAAAKEEAARTEAASRPERYQAALQRYETTQGQERLVAAAEVVALHDSVPPEIQRPREAWIAARTVVNSTEAKAAKANRQAARRPTIEIGGHDAYRLVGIADSQIQQYETAALARAEQQRAEAARYKEGVNRMAFGTSSYSREEDIRASTAVLQLNETAGPQSGISDFNRGRAVSRASLVLAYAMPQELTDQGMPRTQAEAVIAQAKTQLAHETAQRDAEREAQEAARRPQVEAARPVQPPTAAPAQPPRSTPVTTTSTASVAPAAPAATAWTNNPDILRAAQTRLGYTGPMGVASAVTRADGFVGFQLKGENIPPHEVLRHFNLPADQLRVVSNPGQQTRVIMHADTYTHVMNTMPAVARESPPPVQAAPAATATTPTRWSENLQLQAEAQARLGTDGALGISRLRTSNDGRVGIEFNGSQLNPITMATQLGVKLESLSVVNTAEGARTAVTLSGADYAGGAQATALKNILQERLGRENIHNVTFESGPNGRNNYTVTTPDDFSRSNMRAVGIDPLSIDRRSVPGAPLAKIVIPSDQVPTSLATEMSAGTNSAQRQTVDTRQVPDTVATRPSVAPTQQQPQRRTAMVPSV